MKKAHIRAGPMPSNRACLTTTVEKRNINFAIGAGHGG